MAYNLTSLLYPFLERTTFTYDANSYRQSLHDGTSLTKFLYAWQTGTPGLDPILMETDGSDATVAVYAPTA